MNCSTESYRFPDRPPTSLAQHLRQFPFAIGNAFDRLHHALRFAKGQAHTIELAFRQNALLGTLHDKGDDPADGMVSKPSLLQSSNVLAFYMVAALEG